jgi:hypothetical protein
MHPDPVAIVHVHGSINRVDSCSECGSRKRIRDIFLVVGGSIRIGA